MFSGTGATYVYREFAEFPEFLADFDEDDYTKEERVNQFVDTILDDGWCRLPVSKLTAHYIFNFNVKDGQQHGYYINFNHHMYLDLRKNVTPYYGCIYYNQESKEKLIKKGLQEAFDEEFGLNKMPRDPVLNGVEINAAICNARCYRRTCLLHDEKERIERCRIIFWSARKEITMFYYGIDPWAEQGKDLIKRKIIEKETKLPYDSDEEKQLFLSDIEEEESKEEKTN